MSYVFMYCIYKIIIIIIIIIVLYCHDSFYNVHIINFNDNFYIHFGGSLE